MYHELAECTELRHARRRLREVASVLVPEVDKESVPSFIIAGQHKSIARKRATLALRGCFFAQWRERSAQLLSTDGSHAPAQKSEMCLISACAPRSYATGYAATGSADLSDAGAHT